MMLTFIQRLTSLRRRLSTQLQALESGEVKVLLLLDGGATDEDDTARHIEELHACLRDIDRALDEAGVTQKAAAALTSGYLSAASRDCTTIARARAS
ncbi:MAG: hypothetical protein JOZ34_01520 [Gammaproteobacteria bacterium]|nr:hypothetical protein [Gammaproteobacteria bacterium]